MTSSRREPARDGHRQADTPSTPGPHTADRDMPETAEPYDLPSPDHWPPGRPEYVIVVEQLRDWQPSQPPSLAELLETGRTRGSEPDLEAEP